MALPKKLQHVAQYALAFLKWCFLGILVGCIGGLLGAAFHHVLHSVTAIRSQFPWIVWLLPIGGVAGVGLYRLLRMQNNRGTNEIIDAVLQEQPVKPQIAPGIFLSTCITHLFGGSAGREGAALQLGGSVASSLGKLFKLEGQQLRIMIMSGMSAVFAGLFGTPMTAGIFILEFMESGKLFSLALLPCFLSAYTASFISGLLGVHAEGMVLGSTLFTLANSWKYLLLALLVALLGIAMCYIFHKAEHMAHKLLRNDYSRIFAGGILIALLTFVVGDHRFNGAGMDMALAAVEGNSQWYNFLLKLLFTAITLAVGFKGGEIVPTFCIGATFGATLGSALGLDPGIAAALGLIGLFCAVTNAPLAAFVLSLEMFGTNNIYLFFLMCAVTFAFSGKSSLYTSQRFYFPKFTQKEPATPHF